MKATIHSPGPADQGLAAPQREIELPALVPITWSVAGGMLMGGAAVAVLVMTDNLSGHGLIASSAAFYMLGAVIGLVHGLLLGVFGRPDGVNPRQALAGMAHGLIYLVPALLLGWLAAGWVAALPIALRGRHLVAGAITAVAWLLMIATVVVAISAGLAAARLAFRRWKDRLAGTLLVMATLAALVTSFAIEQPTVWFINVRLTFFGSMLFAVGLTLWFYGPIITVALELLRRAAPYLPSRAPAIGHRGRALATRAAVAVVAGLLVAMLAVPFHAGVTGLPTDVERLGALQAMLLAVSDAVTDELLLRLFLFTAAFMVASRHMSRHAWTVGTALAVSMAADLFLHLPTVVSYGLPGPQVMASYLVSRLAIPALLFGYLYWRRGLGTAVTAHAAAGVAVGLLGA